MSDVTQSGGDGQRDGKPDGRDGNYLESAPPVPDADREMADGAGPARRPRSIDTAFRLTIIAAIIGTFAAAKDMVFDREWIASRIRPALESSGVPNVEEQVQANIGTFQIAAALGALTFLGLYVLFAMKMRAGRNWARIVLTVLTGIGALSFLSAVGSTGAELELMWSLGQVAFGAAAVVYMFQPVSRMFFAERRLRGH